MPLPRVAWFFHEIYFKLKGKSTMMKTTQENLTPLQSGVIRKADELGRICIPKKLRDLYNLNGEVEIFRLSSGIFIKAYTENENICKWCGQEHDPQTLKAIEDQLICQACLTKIQRLTTD